MIEATLSKLIENAGQQSWKLWIYVEPYSKISGELRCITVDVDNAELGSDGFTPQVVQDKGMIEFISMQDLQGILKYLSESSVSDESTAIEHIYYFLEHDSYLPMDNL